MKSFEDLLEIKKELVEVLEDNENVEMEFVIELVESHIEAFSRENYWIEKHLSTLGENIKLLEEIDRLKRRCVSNCVQD